MGQIYQLNYPIGKFKIEGRGKIRVDNYHIIFH
jgi:hypothetical protein